MNNLSVDLEKVSSWKGIFAVLRAWLMIALAVYLGNRFFWFYPISIFIIANRILALGFLIHEGLHILLFPSKKLNDFIGRYFCAYPVFVSFSRFRNIHILHHKFLSTEFDLDKEMYTYFPMTLKTFLYRLITGQIFFGVFLYFTEIDTVLNLKTFFNKMRIPIKKMLLQFEKSDLPSFLIFQGTTIAFFIYFQVFSLYLKFWLLPYLILQPYILVYNCLQHSGVYQNSEQEKKSRTILGPAWLMSVVLPVNVNFHAEHHLNQKIPQYNLKKFSTIIQTSNPGLFYYENYFQALESIFKRRTNEK